MGDINAPIEKYGVTRLHRAALDGNLEEVRRLVEAGANVNKKDLRGNTAFWIAYQFSATPAYRAIVKYLINIPGIDAMGWTKLCYAVQTNDLDEVSRLLEAGEDVNQRSPGHGTPLFIASISGFPEIVERLLAERDIEINKNTPLYFAAQEGHLPVVDLLIRAGADVNQPADNSETPLFVASQNGHTDIVQRLLSVKGIDVNKLTKGETALCTAVEFDNPDVVKQLLGMPGIDITVNCNGNTAIDLAADKPHIIALFGLPAMAWQRRRHAVASWAKAQTNPNNGDRRRRTRRRRTTRRRSNRRT